jgi:hypothetical protein
VGPAWQRTEPNLVKPLQKDHEVVVKQLVERADHKRHECSLKAAELEELADELQEVQAELQVGPEARVRGGARLVQLR